MVLLELQCRGTEENDTELEQGDKCQSFKSLDTMAMTNSFLFQIFEQRD